MTNDYLPTLTPKTAKAYASHFRAFERWHGSPVDAVLASKASFYQLTSEWMRAMEADGLKPSTIRARLAAIKGLATYARKTDRIDWAGELPTVRGGVRPDVSGPPPEKLAAMLKGANPRDALALGLLGLLGLRLNEVRSLDLAHLDRSAYSLSVLRKGKGNARQLLGYPEEFDPLFSKWLAVRGIAAGPLLCTLAPDGTPQAKRPSPEAYYDLVKRAGRRVGLDTHPHALRHTAITIAMEAAGGAGIPIEDVRAFSGHREVRTMMIYRDVTSDRQRELAGMVTQRVIGGSNGAGNLHAGRRVL